MAITKRAKTPAKTKPEGTQTTAASIARSTHSLDSVAMRAYEIWRESGCVHGSDQAHWFRAEQELRARMSPTR